MIYIEKETLKTANEKLKMRIDSIQSESSSPAKVLSSSAAASEAIKKLNESMKNKTAEVSGLQTKNKELAEEL